LILDVADVSASSGDGQHLLPAIQRIEEHVSVMVERAIGDGAYGSGENRAACAHYPAHPLDLVAPQARPGDLEVDKAAFQIDLAAKTATWPARSARLRPADPISRTDGPQVPFCAHHLRNVSAVRPLCLQQSARAHRDYGRL
jgi:hypothetical protein